MGALWIVAQLFTALAAAQAEPEEYRGIVSEAVSEHSAGRYIEARALFEQAYRRYPNARALRGIGMAEFELRNYVSSVAYLEQALASTVKPLDAALRAQTEKLLLRARQYVSVVRLTTDPSDATVQVDSFTLERPADGKLALQAGDRVLEVSAPGRVSQRRTLRLPGGDESSLHIALAQESPTGAPTPTTSAGTPVATGPLEVQPSAATVAAPLYSPHSRARVGAFGAEHRSRFNFGLRTGGPTVSVGGQLGLDRVYRFFRLGVELRVLKTTEGLVDPLFLDLAFKPAFQLVLGAGRAELYLATPIGPSLHLYELGYDASVEPHGPGLHLGVVLGATWFFMARLGLNIEIGWQGRWLDDVVSAFDLWSKAISPAVNLVVPFGKPRTGW